MTDPCTLADLKVGDEVAVVHGSARQGSMFPQRVARITPTRIILDDKNAYYKDGGRRVGFSVVGISLSKNDLALALQNETEHAERSVRMRAAQVEYDAVKLRQREALARLEEYIAAWHGLNHELIAAVGGTQLLMSDLIEVVKMARKI